VYAFIIIGGRDGGAFGSGVVGAVSAAPGKKFVVQTVYKTLKFLVKGSYSRC